jgi:hypothetical protein
MKFRVTEKATRPVQEPKDSCFYCHEPIGEFHKDDCVLVNKKVKVMAIVEYEIEVPNSWDKQQIEFSRNLGSWCADNMLDELYTLSQEEGCLCDFVTFKYLEDVGTEFLDE